MLKFPVCRITLSVILLVAAIMDLGVAEDSKVQIDWIIHKKINWFGDTLTLFCPVPACCKETAGWARWNVNLSDFDTIVFSVKDTPYSEENKFDSRIGKTGFYLMIRNTTAGDLERHYSCTYGINISPKKLLKKSEAFTKKVTTSYSPVGSKGDLVSVNYVYVLLAVVVGLCMVVILVSIKLCNIRKNQLLFKLLDVVDEDDYKPTSCATNHEELSRKSSDDSTPSEETEVFDGAESRPLIARYFAVPLHSVGSDYEPTSCDHNDLVKSNHTSPTAFDKSLFMDKAARADHTVFDDLSELLNDEQEGVDKLDTEKIISVRRADAKMDGCGKMHYTHLSGDSQGSQDSYESCRSQLSDQ